MVTLSDIAKIAGVNISTVSRALSNSPGISDNTKRKIQTIASELGYQLKPHRGMNNVIGVIIPELLSQYYAELTHTLEQRIKARGYSMIIKISGFDSADLVDDFNNMVQHNIKGIICSLPFPYSAQEHCNIAQAVKGSNIPTVFFSEVDSEEHIVTDYICLDQKSGIEQIVDHLINLGHKEMGFVGENLSISRLKIFVDALEQRGFDINEKHISIGESRFEKGGYEQMKKLLTVNKLPTAVFVSYDQYAIGALKAIEEANLSVPEDISVVSFDNIATNDFLSVKLTSVTNPVVSMGQIATRILFNKIRDPKDSVVQKVFLQPKLLIRESTGPVKDLHKINSHMNMIDVTGN